MAALKTPWYDKAVEALKLNGKSERTQEAYARHVRKLIEFYDGKDPDKRLLIYHKSTEYLKRSNKFWYSLKIPERCLISISESLLICLSF